MRKTHKPKPFGGFETRDPVVKNRDPVPQKRRYYIAAPTPLVCPICGHSTRMADGKYTDPVRKTILEYRTCCWCGQRIAAGRAMTPVEVEKYCTHVEAVAEYESENNLRLPGN